MLRCGKEGHRQGSPGQEGSSPRRPLRVGGGGAGVRKLGCAGWETARQRREQLWCPSIAKESRDGGLGDPFCGETEQVFRLKGEDQGGDLRKS